MDKKYFDEYDKILSGNMDDRKLSEGTYVLDDGSILSIPSLSPNNRFPYGANGFNFWCYASGYMHANDGMFSMILRAEEGKEPKLAFFAGLQDGYLSLLPVPYLDESAFGKVDRFTVFTMEAAYYYTAQGDHRFMVRVIVDENNKLHISLDAENLGQEEKELKIISFANPYLSNSIAESSEDRWFRKCSYLGEEKDICRFLFKINEDLSRTESVSNVGLWSEKIQVLGASQVKKRTYTTARDEFVGGNLRNLSNPAVFERGELASQKPVTSFTDIAIAATENDLAIEAGETVRFEYELAYMKALRNGESFQRLTNESYQKPADYYLQANGNREEAYLKNLFLKTDDEKMNAFFSYLKKQVEFCGTIKGYVQLTPNSLIGIRDVFQALEAMLYIDPQGAREKMLEAFSYIDPSGRCPRQYGIPKVPGDMPPVDLRKFIDQGCWVIDTVITYIKYTKDFDFLKADAGYYEIVDDKKKIVKKSEKRDSVLSHMIAIMDFLLGAMDPDTGCIRALYGDWNDALDGLGVSNKEGEEFGNGVSVMATLQVYKNLNAMVELLDQIGQHSDKIIKYMDASAAIESGLMKNAIITDGDGNKRILHGWGQDRSYFVGSHSDSDGLSRYGLTSNAFFIISGMIRKYPELKGAIKNAYDHLDSKYGYKTFDPHFTVESKGVGRIYKLPKGTAENGATYVHATAFAILSLFMIGEDEMGFEQLEKILPYKHETTNCSPYVMPNSYGYNPELSIDGQSMLDWQTGSSNVVMKLLIWYVLGIRPDYDCLVIAPSAHIPYKTMEYSFVYLKRRIHVLYERKGIGTRKYLVNCKEVDHSIDEATGNCILKIADTSIAGDLNILVTD
ncbi:MAG: hypothetical protein K5773_03125 [Pseudobutyrivibrio sp.]|nr:hypothetical protein [Pseudobutyrivibrio sp.]